MRPEDSTKSARSGGKCCRERTFQRISMEFLSDLQRAPRAAESMVRAGVSVQRKRPFLILMKLTLPQQMITVRGRLESDSSLEVSVFEQLYTNHPNVSADIGRCYHFFPFEMTFLNISESQTARHYVYSWLIFIP